LLDSAHLFYTENMSRKILHLDLDAFFCAVEEQHNPTLRGVPFAVGGTPQERGVVASCSYPARRFGVHSAMPMVTAVRICPGLRVVPAKHINYRAVSVKVMALLHELTPLVEQLSIDEAFLDVTELPEDAETLAHRLQADIRGRLNLPCSLGVASNKLVAKIANNIGKKAKGKDDYPNAITVIPVGQEAEFLAPLPAGELWGVGEKTAERLARLGLHTIGDIAQYPAPELERLMGKNGADIARHARGLDDRPIDTDREIKSVSRETTFTRDISSSTVLKETLLELAVDVGKYLRRKHLRGSTIKLKLRWTDFTTLTRQLTLPEPTDSDDTIYAAGLRLLEAHRPTGESVRLIGVGISGFAEESGVRQMGLWDAPEPEPDPRLKSAIDDLRQKFGEGAVQRGSDLLD
jgi:DNA polymerase IV